jgi:hypothetical protein
MIEKIYVAIEKSSPRRLKSSENPSMPLGDRPEKN